MSKLPQQLGNYLLEHQIGRGASSEVWLARHAHLEDRQVAIKVLMGRDDESIQRFQREANLAGQLHHPHIVQVYDHGVYKNLYYTVLEYVHGGSLQALLERYGALPLDEAVRIFAQVADALDFAHSCQVIHRDVSPGNILIDQETGRALLSDFGIARDLNTTITVDTTIMGTPAYWSPEHTQSATAVTHVSDIFGLGAVLYALLSGVPPWDDQPALAQTDFVPPPLLHERGVRNLPPELDRVLQTMLAIDPAKRYPSAQAAVAEVQRVVQRHQVVTHHSGAPDNNDDSPPANEAPLPEPDAVEQALGPDLIRSWIVQARERAAHLSAPDVVANLLDSWAARRALVRRLGLGRLARIHSAHSYNCYAFTLRVLYEQRSAPVIEEFPDADAEVFPREPAHTPWQVPLEPATDFTAAAGGPLVLPGSARVISCADCEGHGKLLCTRCEGRQRIIVPRPTEGESPTVPPVVPDPTGPPGSPDLSELAALLTADETMLVPCPACEGTGGLACARCDSTGRLVQRQTFTWQRTVETFTHSSDPAPQQRAWLKRTCTWQPIYHEQARHQTPQPAPPTRPEWAALPELANLLAQAQDTASDTLRMSMCEVQVSFLPVTDVTFTLTGGLRRAADDELLRLSVYGFEQAIPDDWRFLNWERVVFVYLTLVLVALIVVLAVFALRS